MFIIASYAPNQHRVPIAIVRFTSPALHIATICKMGVADAIGGSYRGH